MKNFRILIFVVLIFSAGLGCSPLARRLVLGDAADYLGVTPVDSDLLTDSNGDGDPANDFDNSGALVVTLIDRILSNPTPIGIATVLGGLGAYVGYKALRRKLKKNSN